MTVPDQTDERPGLRHVAALDGLRGVAIAGVLLFHSNHLSGGFLGVELFFVLSGFLITSLLIQEGRASGRISLASFWARRARRLLPALALLMVGIAVYCWWFSQPVELARIRRESFATMLYVANWQQIYAAAHHLDGAVAFFPSPLTHTWSLAIEEQFYLVWPIVVSVVIARWRRIAPWVIFATALVLATVSAILMAALYAPNDFAALLRVYVGTDTRGLGVLLGAALAALVTARGPVRSGRGRIGLEIAALLGALVLAVLWTRADWQSSAMYRGGFVVCDIAAVMVIAAAAHPHRLVVARVLSFRPLCLLGLISYGVYLWQVPVELVLNPRRTGLTGWSLFSVQVAVTLAIATASFFLLERPIRRGALSNRQLAVVAPIAAVAIVVLLLIATAR